jgi:Domain of unknown function (DUF4160)
VQTNELERLVAQVERLWRLGHNVSHLDGTSGATATMRHVPRISEFYGIVIAMYYREHGVPHFHATYAGATVVVSIQTGDVIAGAVSPRALRLVQEWYELHRDELRLNWDRARENAPLVRIDPLP